MPQEPVTVDADRGPEHDPVRVERLSGPDAVAGVVADELVARLRAVQKEGRVPVVVLTGGSISRKVHAAVANHPDRRQVDWKGVEVWWGDERFVAASDPERNATQAWEDMLGDLPLDRARVHEVPAADQAADVATAAHQYAEDLQASFAGRLPSETWFDVLMLGIGPDGHCASLFPGRDEVTEAGLALPVTGSPKPPPERVTMTMEVLGKAREVWFVATGEEKADAVARSLAGGDVRETPSAGPRGRGRTTWYVDEAAASQLP